MIRGWTSCSRASASGSNAYGPCSCRSAGATGMTADPALLTLLQFADGLFPAGGFAHSFGLETYVQDGRVRDRQDLESFVAAYLEGSAGPADAAAAAIAVGIARHEDSQEWIELDARLDAMKSVPEFRLASRQMGRQALRIAVGIGDDPFLARLAAAVQDGRAAAHHATVFGAAVGREGADPERAATAYLYTSAALLVGAGLRLIALGPLGGSLVREQRGRAREERLPLGLRSRVGGSISGPLVPRGHAGAPERRRRKLADRPNRERAARGRGVGAGPHDGVGRVAAAAG